MRHPFTTLPPAALLFGTALAVAAPASQAADCVPAGNADTNGDGFDDALVSPRAVLFEAELDCTARVGAGSVIVGARLEEAEEFDSPRPAVVGESSFVGPGATLQGATIGNRSFVLRGARLSAGINAEVTLGDRSFVGRNTVITSGNSRTDIGEGALIRNDVLIRGARVGSGARIGPGVELNDFEAGERVRVGAGSTLGFRAAAGDRVRIGARSEVGSESFIGPDVTIGASADIGTLVSIGQGTAIGEFVTIGDGADIGDGVTIGDDAWIGEGANVPDGTTIGSGETFAGQS